MKDRAQTGAVPVIFAVAGFDPSAGAGATADLKTIAALGGYGVACLTALTVQSMGGVRRVEELSGALIRETLAVLAGETPPSAIKIGMLHRAEAVEAVADFVAEWQGIPTVLDPVIRSSSGAELLDAAGLEAVRRRLLPRVGWVTPNLAEAAVLSGRKVARAEDVTAAAAEIQRQYPRLNVVITGGHLGKPDDYLLAAGDGGREGVWVEGDRIEADSVAGAGQGAGHGTGCAFSTALAVALANGAEPEAAVRAAKDYVSGALRHAVSLSGGRSALNHFWRAGCSSE